MELKQVPLRDVDQTVAEILRLIATCYRDVAKYATMPVGRFYDMVRNLPYRADPKGNEFLQRPSSSLNGWSQWRDCDDKAILLGAYAKAAAIPYRIAIGGSKAVISKSGTVSYPFHHVWPEFKILGRWFPMDATYPKYSPYIYTQNYKALKFYYPNPS